MNLPEREEVEHFNLLPRLEIFGTYFISQIKLNGLLRKIKHQ